MSKDRLKALKNASKKTKKAESIRQVDDIEEARTNEEISKSENRKILGCFAVRMVMFITLLITFIVSVMCIRYVISLLCDVAQLKLVLIWMYEELKHFIVQYQSVFAIILTLMFGDKIVNKLKEK